ncbi:E3 ubiquitin-protein ligase APD2 isoform X2 [Lycium ferocissimum]|uniref:E3 ubiquitin-protein ligase APD2 isoform X2 n=1 Tax=Lycium ferocissimum TaxID=112874 RepID=UPI002814CE51|nr:E3 ubiquitin-protein ligase APD2 isoform X2 [Lycium ferocissimum]
MEESDQFSGDASTSDVPVIDDDDIRPPVPFPERINSVFDHNAHNHFPVTHNDQPVRLGRDDTCSCIVVILTFCFFLSMTLMLGIYGPGNLQLGPNSSILIKPNPLFVKNIKVEETDDANNRPTVYGFHENPSLDVFATLSEAYRTSLPANTNKQWIYYLNQGSQINISYSVKSSSSFALVLIIAQGSEGLAQWLEDPSYPNTTLSWNIIHGSGTISQHIAKSSSYYVAVGNLNTGVVQVRLDIRSRALLYNTTGAYYECNLGREQCSMRFSLARGNSALLTSPSQRPDTATGMWSIKLSYGPRWITYLLGLGGMSFLIWLVFWYLNNMRSSHQEGISNPVRPMESQQTPLLSRKDDDLASRGSSYDGLSQDDEYNEDGLDLTAPQGRQVKDGEYNSNIRRLCTICFDAPRDCFFLPCGHHASCFECGTSDSTLAT